MKGWIQIMLVGTGATRVDPAVLALWLEAVMERKYAHIEIMLKPIETCRRESSLRKA